MDGPPSAHFRFVQVVGEPGIGKSRLLAELADAARARGQEVVVGRATEFETDRPFGVLADALDDHFAALGPAWFDRLGELTVTRCAAVFPAFGDGVEHPGAERNVLHRAVRAALEAATGRRGLLVVLDDLHWADAATLELLDHLARRPGRGRLTFVVAYRPRQLSTAGHTMLARALSDGNGHRLELAPLGQEAAARLLGPETGRARALALHRASRGNPLYLQALARASVPAEWANAPEEVTEELPAHVRAALLSEVDRLDEVTRLVVRGAAVAGEPVDAELVAVTCELPLARVRAAVDAALAADVLRGGTGTRAVEFRHPLLRHLVYDAAPLSWREEAHRRLAEVLRQRGVRPEHLARHLERTARAGDAETAAVLVEAARQVRFRAPATAARWLAAALELVEAGPLVRVELADALTASGQFEEGARVLGDLVRRRPGTPNPAYPRAVVLWSTLERWLDRFQGAPVLREVLAAADPADVVSVAALHHELAYTAHARGEAARAEEHAARVVSAPPVSGVRTLQASACGLLSFSRLLARDLAAASDWIDRAITAFDELTDNELSEHLLAIEHGHWAALFQGRYEDVVRHGRRIHALVRGTGHHLVLLRSQLRAATALFMLGELAEAERCTEDAIELATLVGRPFELALSLLLMSEVIGDRGEVERSLKCAEEAVDLARAHDMRSMGPALFQLAEARRMSGLPVDFAEDFPELDYGHPASRTMELPGFQLEQLIQHAAAQGQFTFAESALRHCQALVHDLARGSAGHAHLAEAHLRLLRGDPDTSVELARRAVAEFTAAELPLNAGKARLALGMALAELGRRPEALAELDQAGRTFADRGALRWEELTVKQQRRQGRRIPKPASRSAPGELTARESEIAELVSKGHTNRAIAERLVLSERTVTTHVSNILAKLDLPSRTALAAYLLRS
ncbi:DNA-binding CsgD family transcriptional regulator [Crossiella equi]|uniref:DNA-binding CsgD family transcriptional regulator n=1 Tax=Crossiella equi TaxID=130796 RepID=A0ABS5AK63_9PSEU|nr:DNA-binding CsgD family transcriptional regulator [Crossiella equi]